jgi:hypothetical protein
MTEDDMSSTNGNGTAEERYADRINKLLEHAEGASTQEEAEAFFEKAQALMTQYAITEAMLANARGEELEEIVTDRLDFTGTQQKTLMLHVFDVASRNDCKAHFMPDVRVPKGNGRGYTKVFRVIVAGYKSDVERVKLLSASIDMQRASAMSAWWKNHGAKHYMTLGDQWKEKRTFLQGYNHGLATKLSKAAHEGRKAAEAAEAERTGATAEATTKSVALVLRSRKDNVKDWYDERYGGSLRSSRMGSRTSGSRSAYGSGFTAGQSANTGQPNVGGSRTALNG